MSVQNLIAAANSILDELNDKYDGAPDSNNLWMGEHIHRLQQCLDALRVRMWAARRGLIHTRRWVPGWDGGTMFAVGAGIKTWAKEPKEHTLEYIAATFPYAEMTSEEIAEWDRTHNADGTPKAETTEPATCPGLICADGRCRMCGQTSEFGTVCGRPIDGTHWPEQLTAEEIIARRVDEEARLGVRK